MFTAVFSAMGTTVSVRLPAASDDAGRAIIRRLEQIFADLDERFSLYRPESELSAVANNTLALARSSAELRAAYAEALLWRQHTDSAFTPHRPDGIIDLNGTIKATAMQRSVAAFEAAGISDWCLNVGGDVSVGGAPSAHAGWIIGIVDPADRAKLLCSVVPNGGKNSVATSGSAERGDHIWRSPGTESSLVQVTVLAEDIVTADVLATAIVSGGEAMLNRAIERWPIDVLCVDRGGALKATAGFRAALART